MMKDILDATCGSRSIWFDKANPRALFLDNRRFDDILQDGRRLEIKPDVIGDFTSLPFPDNSFYLVVFDPSHLIQLGHTSILAQKYGVLPQNWQDILSAGFRECLRVLKPCGTLAFKWSERQIPLKKVLECCPVVPLFGTRVKARTYWVLFMKDGETTNVEQQDLIQKQE